MANENVKHGGDVKQPPELKYLQRTVSSSVCPPAVRTVLVVSAAYEDFDEDGNGDGAWKARTSIYPVLALKSVVFKDYYAVRRDGAARGPSDEGTEKELLRRGWRLQWQDEETRVVVSMPEEGGLVEWPGSSSLDGGVISAVPCLWPPEEDEKRLADLVREQEAKAIRYAQAKYDVAVS